jgi:hypothetical protein
VTTHDGTVLLYASKKNNYPGPLDYDKQSTNDVILYTSENNEPLSGTYYIAVFGKEYS